MIDKLDLNVGLTFGIAAGTLLVGIALGRCSGAGDRLAVDQCYKVRTVQREQCAVALDRSTERLLRCIDHCYPPLAGRGLDLDPPVVHDDRSFE